VRGRVRGRVSGRVSGREHGEATKVGGRGGEREVTGEGDNIK